VGAKVVVSFEGAIVTEVDLDKPVTVLGRHSACDIVIDHPAISARHMLLRVVDRTVYAEDLASTNGTRVNGHAVEHQVLHHLDLIEVGRHKLHFFDEALLGTSAVESLEDTVLTDYERTMLAVHVAAPRASHSANSSSHRRGDDGLSRTLAIARDPAVRMGPAQETVRTDAPAQTATRRLALRVVAGGRPGEVIALDQANTMIGTVGVDTAIVVRRGDGYFLARLAGSRPPRINRRELAPGTHPLALRDEVQVGDLRFEVIEAAA
jgi:pSer/pThr/pTyr-binding forkhead associated (FHA) protein